MVSELTVATAGAAALPLSQTKRRSVSTRLRRSDHLQARDGRRREKSLVPGKARIRPCTAGDGAGNRLLSIRGANYPGRGSNRTRAGTEELAPALGFFIFPYVFPPPV